MKSPDGEWSLILFNILGEMSVGVFIALGVAYYYARRKAGLREADRLSTLSLLALGPILVLGMLLSLGHLGNPQRALNAISNIGTSWLGREVATYGAFLVVGGVFAVLQAASAWARWRETALPAFVQSLITPVLRNVLAVIAAILGLAFVYSAAMIYADPRLASRQTAWAHNYTPILFFADTVLLGVLAFGAALILNYLWIRRSPNAEETQNADRLEILKNSVRVIALVSVIALGVLFVIIPIYLVYLSTDAGDLGLAVLDTLHNQFAPHWFFRLVLAFVGAVILTLFSWYTAEQEGREQLMYLLVIAAFVVVFIAETLARYLFYARNFELDIFRDLRGL